MLLSVENNLKEATVKKDKLEEERTELNDQIDKL